MKYVMLKLDGGEFPPLLFPKFLQHFPWLSPFRLL
jgi:hypothetical protein